MQDEKYSQLYERLVEQVTQQHKHNQQRIRKGLWCLPGVTVLFLLLVMLTDGSRNIYLLLWIAAVFALAAYLISVEYADYEMQKNLSDVTQLEQELGGLMNGSAERTRRFLNFSGLQRNAAGEEPAAEDDNENAADNAKEVKE